MPPSLHTTMVEGTFADQVGQLKLVLPEGATPTFFYAVGSKKESISEKKELFAAKGTNILHSGAAAVRKALKLGNGPLTLKTADLPAGVTLFVQSTSASRKLKAGEVFVVDVEGASLVSPGTPSAAAATTKRGRCSAAADEASAAASRKATLVTKRSGKFWSCREGRALAPSRVCPAGTSFEDGDPFLTLIDGASGKSIKTAPSYCDTEMFNVADFGKPFRPMADEVRKWRWAATFERPDTKPAKKHNAFEEKPWALLQIDEPRGRRFKNEDEANNAGYSDDDDGEPSSSLGTDGSYMEVWGRDPSSLAGRVVWSDIAVLAQFGPHPLYCACVGGHPFVQTADFCMCNSDGSTEPPEPPSRGAIFEHPLQLLALAEIYCCQQVH